MEVPSRDTIYKEVPLKKEYYHSVTDDVEIWHSGVASALTKGGELPETHVSTMSIERTREAEVLGLEHGTIPNAFRMPLQLSLVRHSLVVLDGRIRRIRGLAEDFRRRNEGQGEDRMVSNNFQPG